MTKNSLQLLNEAGESIWLDYIDRTMLRNGDLARRIRDDALTGMTSNPTIFEKALAEGTEYDDQIRSAPRRLTAMELFELIATTDVRAACDAFAGVHEQTQRRAMVSCRSRCRPARRTMHARRSRRRSRLWATVDRPQRDDQGAGNDRRREGGSPAHRERNQRQHHAVVLDRRVSTR